MTLDTTAAHSAINGLATQHDAIVSAIVSDYQEVIAEKDVIIADQAAEIDRLNSLYAPQPTVRSIANGQDITIAGVTYRAQTPDQPHNLQEFVWPDGTLMHRFEIREGERWPSDVASFPNDDRQRCMLRGFNALPFNTPVWCSFAMRLDGAPYRTATSFVPYNIVANFLSAAESGESGKSGPFQIDISNANLEITAVGDPNAVTTTSSRGVFTNVYTEKPWNRDGQWIQVVVRSVFTKGTANGELDVWFDGQQLVSRRGLVYGYNDTKGPDWKMGIYRSGWTETMTAEFVNLEVGTADLSARVTSPKPVPFSVRS